MEDERIFDLITKMYSDMNDKLDKLQYGQENFENRFTKLESEIVNVNMTIENNVLPKIEVLFDGYVQNSEHLKRIEQKVDELSDKVEKNDYQIKVIKGGRI